MADATNDPLKPGEMRFFSDEARRRFGALLRHLAMEMEALGTHALSDARRFENEGEFVAWLADPAPDKGINNVTYRAPYLERGKDYDINVQDVVLVPRAAGRLMIGIPNYARVEHMHTDDAAPFFMRLASFYRELATFTADDADPEVIAFATEQQSLAKKFLDLRIADYSVEQCA